MKQIFIVPLFALAMVLHGAEKRPVLECYPITSVVTQKNGLETFHGKKMLSTVSKRPSKVTRYIISHDVSVAGSKNPKKAGFHFEASFEDSEEESRDIMINVSPLKGQDYPSFSIMGLEAIDDVRFAVSVENLKPDLEKGLFQSMEMSCTLNPT